MISSIRESFKSRTTQALVLVVILAPVIAALSMFIFGPRGRGLNTGPWIATVNGNSINVKSFANKVGQIENYIKSIREEYKEAAGFIMKHMGFDQDPKELALEMLIHEQLVAQLVSSLNLHLHDQYVEKGITKQIPPALIMEDGSINVPLLRTFLERTGITMSEFESAMEKELERQLALSLLSNTSYTPNYIVRDQFRKQHAGKKFAVIRLPLETVLADIKKTPLTDDEIRAFFEEQNRARRYWKPEQRAGIAWRFNPVDYGATISDEQVRAHYEKNKKTLFLETPVQMQVRRILLKISEQRDKKATNELAQRLHKRLMAEPDSFNKLASEHSDGDEKGGVLPFFSKGTHDPAFDRAAFLLPKDGDISAIIKTANGIEILQRVARKDATARPFSAVESEIKTSLLKINFHSSFSRDIKPFLRNKAKLEEFAAKHGGRREEIKLQESNGDKVISGLFSTNEQEASFFFDDNQAVVVMLTERLEDRAANLVDVEKQVVDDLYTKKAHDEIKVRLKKGSDSELNMETATAADRMKARQEKIPGSRLIITDWVNKSDNESIKKIQSEELPLMQMFQLEKPSSGSLDVETHQDASGGYLFILLEREPIDEARFGEKQGDLRAAETNKFTQLIQGGFIANLRKNATIKVNGSFFATK